MSRRFELKLEGELRRIAKDTDSLLKRVCRHTKRCKENCELPRLARELREDALNLKWWADNLELKEG